MTHSIKAAGILLAVCGAAALSSCGSSPAATDDTTTTTPVTRTTDTFLGNLAQGGATYHLFSVVQQGQVDITLTRTEPLATITVGLGIGQTSGGQCIPVLLAYNNAAQAGTVMSGTAAVGAYCAVVYDLGNVAEPVNYTVTVTHP